MNKEMKIRAMYVILLTVAMLVLVSPFFTPIFFAATVSLTLHPLLVYMEKKGFSKSFAAALLTTLFAVVISIPLFFFIIKGTNAVTTKLEGISFDGTLKGQEVQEIVTDIRRDVIVAIQKFSEKYNISGFFDEKKIIQYMGLVINYLLKFFQSFLSNLPTYVVLYVIMILCTYSFLNNASSVRKFFQKLIGFSDHKMDHLIKIFISNSRQVYLTNIITGSIQSVIVATGASVLGIGEFFLVFFVTLILSFIPVIGAAPVALVLAVLAFLRGNTTAAIILLVLSAFTGVIDNILRPWVATFGQSKIPPIVAFTCVIGGALLLGFPGLFIGLLIGSIAYDTLPIFWEEFHPR